MASPLSVVAITAAKIGPFDVGTVVVRLALVGIDPRTARDLHRLRPDQIRFPTSSPASSPTCATCAWRAPIVPRRLLNPTGCDRRRVAATVFGAGLDFTSSADRLPVASRDGFQAANCAALPYEPRLSLRLLGGTRRGAHPGLRAVFRPRVGDANSERISVALPRAEFLEQGHIRTICTRVPRRRRCLSQGLDLRPRACPDAAA